MILLNKDDIKRVFTMKDAIDADKLAFSLFSKGKSESPLRTNFTSVNGNGNTLYMPGYVGDIGVSGVKIVSVFPDNPKKNLPSTPGTILLVNDKDGTVDCMLDGTYVTELRTGAASGAAISLLARKGSKVAAIIGTGGQAESQFDAILSGCDSVEEIRVYSRTEEKRLKFVEKMKNKYKEGLSVIASDSSENAIDGADIVVLATTSCCPVIDGTFIKEGALVCGVGSYMPSMREIDEKTIVKADKIFFDSKEAAFSEAGCLLVPLNENKITEADFSGELGQIINGDIVGRESEKEIIVFKSVGISTQDIVTSKSIYEKAVKNKIGQEINCGW